MRTCDEVIECFLVSGQSDYVRKRSVHTAYFSDRGRWFQRDRGRRFTVIVDGRGCAQATGFIVTQSSMMV